MSPNPDGFNKDELEAPDWLNAEFLTKVLRQCENDEEVEVESFKFTPATMKGDHYASVMFRATADYLKQGEKKSKSLIIKTMPELDGLKKDILNESYIFETEIGMYTEVIPKFESILRAVGDETVLSPPCIYHSLSPKKLIIFEDIVPLGYTVLRDREMNMEEVKTAYLKLSKWHAVSYKLALEQPDYFDKYRYGVMNMPSMMENDFMTNGMKFFIEMLDSEPSLSRFKPYFESMEDNLLQNCINSYAEYRDNPQEHSYYVLCHGDFHRKNLMFKHNSHSGKLEDLLLLDYQFSYLGPMVNDIIYSIYMMLDVELRSKHLNELLYYYFSNFVETLEKIGFEGRVPKLLEFRAELMRHKHLELFLLITFLPMWYDFCSGSADVESLMTSADYRRSTYKNKVYIEELQRALPRYLHLGYFDNL